MKLCCNVEGFKWPKAPDVEFKLGEAVEIEDELGKELLKFPFFTRIDDQEPLIRKALGNSFVKYSKEGE